MSNKVPQIRFNGYSDAWVQRNLGDITAWTKGQGLPKEDLNEEKSGLEAVHYADLYKFSPVMHEVIHWTNSDDGRIIPNNSLLFPASDVTPVGLARTSTLKLSGVKAGGDVIIGQLDESINSSFMSYQINATSKKILPLITGTTVKHIQAKSLATLSVSVTNMAEQTAIAGLFERIDKLIAANQRKLDLLKEQKKSYLQKMFPKNGAKVPELRFAGFAADWEERKLSDMANVKTGFPFKNENFVDDGQYLVITNGNIQNDSAFVDGKVGNRITAVTDEIKEKYTLNYGDILVTMDGTVGRTAKVVEGNQILAQRVGRLVSESTPEFIYQWLNTGKFFTEMTKVSHGGTIKHISLSEIGDYVAYVPTSKDEREKIGSLFLNIDKTITLHQRKLDLLKEQKKGFLQKMFV
ncbi:restriction endonuclease subunit S [Weissella cibaria]|uniref:restriction endonuclease subunit S n=1 Tax=Weissella cibaria TaxID=137591 RepID=UPI001FA6C399|nr:restriction endonuclease subunit S [Weissella cibaria]UNW41008.1 restriction endonuclease subunit S [Weissella cibaria]